MDIAVEEVTANGWTFTVRTAGPEDGPPVILLHGFPETSLCFADQLVHLSRSGCRAIAPDQRGYSRGARPADVEQYRLSELVADVNALAGEMGLTPYHLVGHDWGGLVGWALAARHPERLRTFTSLSTPHPTALGAGIAHDPDQAQRSSYLELLRQPDVPEQVLLGTDGADGGLAQVFAGSGIDEAVADSYVRALSEPGALTAALNWYRANDLGNSLGVGPISVPTLYVWSTDDAYLGRRAAEATAALVEGPYRFEVLEKVNHWIPDVASAQLNPLLSRHLGIDA